MLTLREPFADGLHAEAGATRIASTNDWTLKYVRQFGLELVPFRPSGLADVYHVRGRRVVPRAPDEPKWPVPLTAEEQAIGLAGLRRQYIGSVLPRSVTPGIFPGTRLEYEGGASYAWGDDRWSRGAYPTYGPSHVIDLLPAVRASEGRLHFAGEHASVWPGGMQGAFESSNGAARAIDAAPW